MAVSADLRQHNGARLHPGTGGPVLLLSMRKLADLVAYSLAYEFEYTVAELTAADRVDASDWDALQLSRRAYNRHGRESVLLGPSSGIGNIVRAVADRLKPTK